MEAEQRHTSAAEWVRRHTPEDALVFAAQHSGSIRHYAGRTTARWDVLEGSDVSAAAQAAHARGCPAFVVIEGDEPSRVRTRLERPTGADGSSRINVRLLPGAQLGIVQIWELLRNGPTP